MGSILSKIEDDIIDYVDRCERFGEKPVMTTSGVEIPDAYSDHAKELKRREREQMEQRQLRADPFCPRHGRQSRPIEIPGLRCDCAADETTKLKCALCERAPVWFRDELQYCGDHVKQFIARLLDRVDAAENRVRELENQP